MNKKKTIRNRWFIVAISGVLLATIFIYFYTFSPITNDSFFPYCTFKAATGYDCVGCGGQRAVHELLHLNFMSALDYNALFILSIPLLAYYLYFALRWYIYGIASPNSFWYSRSFAILFIALVFVFLITRNLEVQALSWLHSSK